MSQHLFPLTIPPLVAPHARLAEPSYELVPESIRSWWRRAPETTAVQQGTRKYSYGELGNAVPLLRSAMHGAGFNRGEVVAVAGPPSFGLVDGMSVSLF